MHAWSLQQKETDWGNLIKVRMNHDVEFIILSLIVPITSITGLYIEFNSNFFQKNL